MFKDGQRVERLILSHIAPFLPGARLTGPLAGPGLPPFRVGHDTGHRLRLYARPETNQYYVFDRIIPFSNEERFFCDDLVRAMHDQFLRDKNLDASLASELAAWAVACLVAPDEPDTLFRLIHNGESPERFGDGRTFGLCPARAGSGLVAPERIGPKAAGARSTESMLSPINWADIAAWANSGRRIAVRLNEDGQILIFSRRRLLFVKRDDRWHCPPHTLADLEPLAGSIDGVSPETVRALYLTGLDLAAGRGRAVVEIRRGRGDGGAAAELTASRSGRRRADSSGTGHRRRRAAQPPNFADLPRRVRAEMCLARGGLLMDGHGYLQEPEGGHSSRPSGLTVQLVKVRRKRNISPGSALMELFNNGRPGNLRLIIR